MGGKAKRVSGGLIRAVVTREIISTAVILGQSINNDSMKVCDMFKELFSLYFQILKFRAKKKKKIPAHSSRVL